MERACPEYLESCDNGLAIIGNGFASVSVLSVSTLLFSTSSVSFASDDHTRVLSVSKIVLSGVHEQGAQRGAACGQPLWSLLRRLRDHECPRSFKTSACRLEFV